MIEEYIREEKIVPVEITVGLILKAIEADGGGRFLVDGFPRNANNLSGWHAVASASLNVGGVLQYDCPEEVMEARLIERGKTSGRVDDNVESIRKRFAVFERETMPVLQYYEYLGLVHKVDGTRPVDEVWVDTQAAVEAIEDASPPPPPPPPRRRARAERRPRRVARPRVRQRRRRVARARRRAPPRGRGGGAVGRRRRRRR